MGDETKKHTREELETMARAIAISIDRATEPGVGFMLFLYDFGEPGGHLAYISNAKREDMVRAMNEWIARQTDGPSDLHLVTVALGNAIAQLDALPSVEELDDDDAAAVEYCRRVLKAAQAGDLTPIREEIREDDEA